MFNLEVICNNMLFIILEEWGSVACRWCAQGCDQGEAVMVPLRCACFVCFAMESFQRCFKKP